MKYWLAVFLQLVKRRGEMGRVRRFFPLKKYGKARENVKWTGGDDKLRIVLHYTDDTSK